MKYLILTTLIWAFSFSLIGRVLSGEVDPYLAILSRLFLALLVFAPFVKRFRFFEKSSVHLMMIGAIQVGLMYVFYFHAFQFISVSKVALFTIFTPLYLSLLSTMAKKIKLNLVHLCCLFIVLFGSFLLHYHKQLGGDFVIGFILIQLANIHFALGQFLLKKCDFPFALQSKFFYFFLGAFLVVLVMALVMADFSRYPKTGLHVLALLWLGLVASGLALYLWARGSKEVSYSSLSLMNNAVIPVSLVIEFIIFDHSKRNLLFLLGASLLVFGGISYDWYKSTKSFKKKAYQAQ